MPKGRDRRIERTQQLLRGALRSLIQEKGFEALTVQEIIDRANVGRATCYSHFDNKDDLLVSGFEDLRASLKAITSALVGVLMWWLDGRMRLSVDEVNAYFRRLAIPALKAARA